MQTRILKFSFIFALAWSLLALGCGPLDEQDVDYQEDGDEAMVVQAATAAGTGCGGEIDPYANGYSCCTAKGASGGNDTWYAAFRRQDLKTAGDLGTAATWITNAKAKGFAILTAPVQGAIAVITSSAGTTHLGYVTAYTSTQITVDEQECDLVWATSKSKTYARSLVSGYIGFKAGTSRVPWYVGGKARTGGYEIYQYGASGWTLVAGGASDIAVDTNGTAYLRNSTGLVYKRQGTTWASLGGNARDIGVGGGQVYMIGQTAVGGGYEIYKWSGTAWAKVSGGAVRVAVDCDGTAYVVSSGGVVYKRSGTTWTSLGGNAQDIGVGGGQVYYIGKTAVTGGYEIYKRSGTTWVKVSGGAVRVSVNCDGVPYVVNSTGVVYKWSGTTWTSQGGTSAKDIGVGG